LKKKGFLYHLLKLIIMIFWSCSADQLEHREALAVRIMKMINKWSQFTD